MQLVWTVLIGVAAGGVAALTLPGQRARCLGITVGLGALGAVAATYVGQFTGLYTVGEPDAFVGASIGAALLLAVHHLSVRD